MNCCDFKLKYEFSCRHFARFANSIHLICPTSTPTHRRPLCLVRGKTFLCSVAFTAAPRLEDSTKMMENCQLLFLQNSFEFDAPLLNVLPFPSRTHAAIRLLFTFNGWLGRSSHSPSEEKMGWEHRVCALNYQNLVQLLATRLCCAEERRVK